MDEKLLNALERARKEQVKYSINDILKENRKKRFHKILNESYGSFPAQYQMAKSISKQLINKFVNKEYTRKGNNYTVTLVNNSPSFGEVTYSLTWVYNEHVGNVKEVNGNSYYKDKKHFVDLVATTKQLYKPEMVGTIAHEIMHVFQKTLDNVNGVNAKSMLIYQECLNYMDNAVNIFSEYFFYGLYICFSFETAANVSSVANYMESYFSNWDFLKITTKDYTKALKENQKYNNYKTVLDVLTTFKPTIEDKKYITQCMTTPIVSYIDGQMYSHYNNKNFNVDIFIEKNVKNICEICQKTMDKMFKNIMLFVEDMQAKQEQNKKLKNLNN